MTRKEIFECYGIQKIWNPGVDDVELTDEEANKTHKLAQTLKSSFDEVGILQNKDEPF